MHSFKSLKTWQKGRELVKFTYEATNDFPRKEEFALVSQMRRAAVSIPSNVAEGYKRKSNKDKIRFYRIADGSCAELQTQFILACDVGYISEETLQKAEEIIEETQRLLGGFINSTLAGD